MITKIKEFITSAITIIKGNKILSLVILIAGYVAGALTIGPLAALIQYIKDVI